MENPEKEYINKDLYNESFDDFSKNVSSDFIGEDFIDKLEWSMLMISSKFKQIRHADHLKTITAKTFDKAFLLADGMRDDIQFFKPFGDYQVTPQIFPNINVRIMNLLNMVQLTKVKELDALSKRNLKITKKHAYEMSFAYYKKDTESFYGITSGYAVNPSFFNYKLNETITKDVLPTPISLHPNYYVPTDITKYLSSEDIVNIMNQISMAYQVSMTLYYEWTIYIKEYDGIGLIIPIDPMILNEIYHTSIMNLDDKKRMIHFVRDHYRRKINKSNEDYSIYVRKYLRGENKFNYRGFYAEIIPPKYDLNRVTTRKKFIDINS